MTEAGKKWAIELAAKIMTDDYEQAHALSSRAAEFWVHAFCDEVERRADSESRSNGTAIAFDELKRELLGNNP